MQNHLTAGKLINSVQGYELYFNYEDGLTTIYSDWQNNEGNI